MFSFKNDDAFLHQSIDSGGFLMITVAVIQLFPPRLLFKSDNLYVSGGLVA